MKDLRTPSMSRHSLRRMAGPLLLLLVFIVLTLTVCASAAQAPVGPSLHRQQKSISVLKTEENSEYDFLPEKDSLSASMISFPVSESAGTSVNSVDIHVSSSKSSKEDSKGRATTSESAVSAASINHGSSAGSTDDSSTVSASTAASSEDTSSNSATPVATMTSTNASISGSSTTVTDSSSSDAEGSTTSKTASPASAPSSNVDSTTKTTSSTTTPAAPDVEGSSTVIVVILLLFLLFVVLFGSRACPRFCPFSRHPNGPGDGGSNGHGAIITSASGGTQPYARLDGGAFYGDEEDYRGMEPSRGAHDARSIEVLIEMQDKLTASSSTAGAVARSSLSTSHAASPHQAPVVDRNPAAMDALFGAPETTLPPALTASPLTSKNSLKSLRKGKLGPASSLSGHGLAQGTSVSRAENSMSNARQRTGSAAPSEDWKWSDEEGVR